MADALTIIKRDLDAARRDAMIAKELLIKELNSSSVVNSAADHADYLWKRYRESLELMATLHALYERIKDE